MSTFESLGFNVFLSTVVGLTALAGFEIAVLFQFNNQLAPRTSARPRSIIHNVLNEVFQQRQQKEPNKKQDDDNNTNNDNDRINDDNDDDEEECNGRSEDEVSGKNQKPLSDEKEEKGMMRHSDDTATDPTSFSTTTMSSSSYNSLPILRPTLQRDVTVKTSNSERRLRDGNNNNNNNTSTNVIGETDECTKNDNQTMVDHHSIDNDEPPRPRQELLSHNTTVLLSSSSSSKSTSTLPAADPSTTARRQPEPTTTPSSNTSSSNDSSNNSKVTNQRRNGSSPHDDNDDKESTTSTTGVQYHLPYCLSWIPWALNLTYLQMMEGIPGTGTRNDGWSGPTLKCNLDAIILLKFHSLCLKVSVVATILCLGIVLPINYTAPCDPTIHGNVTCQNITELTNFESTTLAHIPPLETSDSELDSIKEFFESAFRGDVSTSMRLYCIVACAYVIYFYTCTLIWEQWVECLALRRVYYLEYNHYKGRQEELDFLNTIKDVPEDPIQEDRPPFLPHPELRETVPNIGLYSVLYKLPSNQYVPGNPTDTSSPSQVDRHLLAATEFFDKIAPNQPGYSSSVAALTILPDVRQVSIAWKKWFQCASKLRRLRFIRKRLQKLREGQKERVEVVFDHQYHHHLNQQHNHNRSDKSHAYASSKSSAEIDELNPLFHDSTPDFDVSSSHSRIDTHQAMDKPSASPSKYKSSASPSKSVSAQPRSNTPRTISQLETVDEGSSDGLSIEETSKDNNLVGSPLSVMPSNSNSEIDEIVKHHTTGSAESVDIGDFLPFSGHNSVDKSSHELEQHLSDTSFIRAPLRGPTPSVSIPSGSEGGVGSRKEAFLASVGLHEEAKLDNFLSEYDIEQLTVYSREFARTSAMCCPFGCDEYTIRRADAATLADLEMEAEESVREASEELRRARAEVRRLDIASTQTNQLSTHSSHRLRTTSMGDSKLNLSVNIMNGVDNGDNSGAEEDDDDDDDEETGRNQTFFSGSGQIMNESSRSTMTQYWEEAESLVERERNLYSRRGLVRRKRKLSTGEWAIPMFHTGATVIKSAAITSGKIAKAAPSIIRTDSYAVVTFTSRQAALAARQCLADGSGLDRWLELEDIPTPSLADAPPWNIFDCRGCCRPVTLTLPQEQKRWRQNFVILFLVLFCFLYTIPLTAASALVTPDELSRTFPDLVEEERVSGFLTGMLYTAFFSICPQIFKVLSNFGSNATSVLHAETSALRYYWIFMLATAFTGTSLATIVIEGVYYNFNVAAEARDVLRQVASTIPTTVGSTWLNWLIVRYSVTLPTNYLLQFPTLAFRAGHFTKCCARMTAGGGPGGPMPYRVYVDSGVAFLCVIGLAPVCPLVAPAAMVYFLVATPMFRWLHIFTYRPQFDGGGFRWPTLNNILITSMLWSQFLLSAMMALKKAWVATFIAGVALVPTYTFSLVVKDRFERCYRDAGLLQTSELDGWDTRTGTSMQKRETYRRWLIDCHKAAYVPVCVNGDDNFLTAEPAVVIPSEHDILHHEESRADTASVVSAERHRFDSMGAISIDAPSPSQGFGAGGIGGTSTTTMGVFVGGGRQRATTWDSHGTLTSANNNQPTPNHQQRGATFRRVAPHPSHNNFSNSSIPTVPSPTSFSSNRNRAVSSGSLGMFNDRIEVGSTKSA